MPRPSYRRSRALPDVSSLTEDQRREAVRNYAIQNKLATKVDPRFQDVTTLRSGSKKKR